jgi:hypothetical protein
MYKFLQQILLIDINFDFFATFANWTCRSKNWRLIDPEYLKTIEDTRKVLKVDAGDMVLWDSRTFHQSQYGSNEERLVQYVCFLPRHHPVNTIGQQSLRRKYYRKRVTTSHWPYPIQGVPYHPDEPLIVPRADLSEYEEKILTLL